MSQFEFITWKSQVDSQRRTMRFVPHRILRGLRQWVFFSVALLMLSGCESGEEPRQPIPFYPDFGKLIEVNGEKLRVIYICGIRFAFPETPQFNWTMPTTVYDPVMAGMKIYLYWPDIPPGSAPGTRYKGWQVGNNTRTNAVDVSIYSCDRNIRYPDNPMEVIIGPHASEYMVRDDSHLGLRMFVAKTSAEQGLSSAYFDDALPLPAVAEELKNPSIKLGSGGFIVFNYMHDIRVRIQMEGWFEANPDWKEIYLGVMETLDKYRRNQK